MTYFSSPDPIGIGGNKPKRNSEHSALSLSSVPGPCKAAPPSISDTTIDSQTRQLAALTYGEASTLNVYEEMAAIAIVTLRQRNARGYSSITAFAKGEPTYAYAAHDGNLRYLHLMRATDSEINNDTGMRLALNAAHHAILQKSPDYSNGAFFWDGTDIKTNYKNHPKVRAGIHFSSPMHNIFGISESTVARESWYKDAKGNNTKLRGRWTYTYESTAAFGKTIFWKLNNDFVDATGNENHR